MTTPTREQVVQFQDAKESWESHDDWRFADQVKPDEQEN